MTETSGTEKVFSRTDDTEEWSEHWLITWNTTKYTHSLSFEITEIRPSESGAPDPVAEGDLKWDGCLNLMFAQRYLHFCGPEKKPMMGRLLEAIYALGPKQEHWDYT